MNTRFEQELIRSVALAERYTRVVIDYVSTGDMSLLDEGLDIGRAFLDEGGSILSMLDLHFQVLASLKDRTPEAESRAQAFLMETVSSIDMVLSGFKGAVANLRLEVNERQQTEKQLRQRTMELAAQRAALDKQVQRRTAVLQRTLDKLQNSYHKLEIANREQSEFTYAISHDLKSPTNTIIILLDNLAEDFADQLGDDGLELVHDTQATARRMLQIVDDVVRYSTTIGSATEHQDVELSVLLAEIEQDIRGEIDASGAQLRIADLPRIKGDRGQLRLLFQNLMSNAIRYRAKDIPCEIDIMSTGSADGTGLVITVRDNGIGIDPAYHDRIFELFRRLHSYSDIAGTGIGLALCKRIVANHHGKIEVQSRPGAGASFIITLPIA